MPREVSPATVGAPSRPSPASTGKPPPDPAPRGRTPLRYFTTIGKYLSSIRTILVNASVILLFCVLTWLLAHKLSISTITVRPIPAPEALTRAGFTPEVLATRVASHLTAIDAVADTVMPRDPFVRVEDSPEFQIGGQPFSIDTIIRVGKELLGFGNVDLNIDVTSSNDSLDAHIFVVGGLYDGARLSVKASEVESLVPTIAEGVLAIARPYVLARYKFGVESNRCSSAPPCDFTEVLLLYEQMLRTPPAADDKWALLGRGLVFYDLKDFTDASKANEHATTLDPEFAYAYVNWGNALAAMDRAEEAMEKYRKAIKLEPMLDTAHNNLGKALAIVGRYDEAIQHFATATRHNGGNYSAHVNWGQALLRTGKPEEALEKFERAVEIDLMSHYAYSGWGLALRDLGHYERAAEKFRKAIEVAPDIATDHRNLGMVLLDLGRCEEAISEITRASELSPRSAATYLLWSSVLERLGRIDEAIEKLEVATGIDQDYYQAYEAWARLLELKGRYREASEKLTIARLSKRWVVRRAGPLIIRWTRAEAEPHRVASR